MSSDAQLLAAWRDGDKTAGNTLFDRHFDALRRFFRNKVDITEVEDLMQRTLLACLEVVPNFRGDASFRTYLFVIARRQLVDYIRRKTRRDAHEPPDLGVTSIADLGITPSRAALAHEYQALIAQAMQAIPVDFQITLELYYWEQLKGPELAEILGISPTTVRTRLHRAREALRKRLTELAPSFEADDDALGSRVAEIGAQL